jgi:hypothetical protein
MKFIFIAAGQSRKNPFQLHLGDLKNQNCQISFGSSIFAFWSYAYKIRNGVLGDSGEKGCFGGRLDGGRVAEGAIFQSTRGRFGPTRMYDGLL